MNKLINYEDQRFKNLFGIVAAKWAILKMDMGHESDWLKEQ